MTQSALPAPNFILTLARLSGWSLGDSIIESLDSSFSYRNPPIAASLVSTVIIRSCKIPDACDREESGKFSQRAGARFAVTTAKFLDWLAIRPASNAAEDPSS